MPSFAHLQEALIRRLGPKRSRGALHRHLTLRQRQRHTAAPRSVEEGRERSVALGGASPAFRSARRCCRRRRRRVGLRVLLGLPLRLELFAVRVVQLPPPLGRCRRLGLALILRVPRGVLSRWR
jgi:hypothetical protein